MSSLRTAGTAVRVAATRRKLTPGPADALARRLADLRNHLDLHLRAGRLGGDELAGRLQRGKHAASLRERDRPVPACRDRAGTAADPARGAADRRRRRLAPD